MKTFIKLVVILFFSLELNAQQNAIYNLHYSNPEFLNPSALSMEDRINASTLYKQYLTGFDGSPRTTFFHVSGPVKDNKLAVGLNLYNDGLGISNKFGIYGSVAYRVKFSDNDHHLTFGASIGALQFSFNPDEVVADNFDDPLLVNKNFSSTSLDGAFGLSYRLQQLRVGLGVNQLFGMTQRLSDEVSFAQERNFYAQASYKFYLDGNKDFSLQPVVLARFAQNPIPQEAALVFNYRDLAWLAPSYKSSGAIGISGGVRILDHFRIGYSYETAAVNSAQNYQNGSHEVMLSYSFGITSRMIREQQEQIDALDEKLDDFMYKQERLDSLQNRNIRENKEQTEENKEDVEQNKEELERLEKEVEETQKELEALKAELIASGVLKPVNAEDFETTEKGYYVVISSINDRNYDEQVMQDKYLSKGYKKLYNKKTGWHYVYTLSTEDFQKALAELNNARKNINKEAWIYILE